MLLYACRCLFTALARLWCLATVTNSTGTLDSALPALLLPGVEVPSMEFDALSLRRKRVITGSQLPHNFTSDAQELLDWIRVQARNYNATDVCNKIVRVWGGEA